jgi:predicted O-methyltransferase YrrM
MGGIKETFRRLLFNVPYAGASYRRLYESAERLHRINPGDYSSAIPSPQDIERESAESVAVREDSLAAISLRTTEQLSLLNELAPIIARWRSGLSSADRYRVDNDWFQFTDAAVLHAMMRFVRPRHVIEIGSGYSSCVMLDTVESDPKLDCRLTLIEPAPERLHSRLRPADLGSVEHLNCELQDVPMERFEALREGDFLFVDSSHVSKCGSDVNRIVHHILPSIAAGVVVHFHDIFFPFRYPRSLLDNGHYWNESYILRAFLEFNEAFEIVIWNDYLRQRHGDALAAAVRSDQADIAASFWMRRVAAPTTG